jgi:DNA-binding transcriptional LysR family regulator
MPAGGNRTDQIGRRLKLRELEVFIAVVRRGSMARAATDLGITQPSVSEIMTNLEHATGMRLLERGPRGVSPTAYGEILLRGGNAAIDDLRQSIREMQFLADPGVGDVRIGCPETVATLLPPIIKRLSRKHPRILVHVSDVVAPTLDLPQLRDRSLDLALVRYGGPIGRHPFTDDLGVEVLFNDELVVVAGRKSRWARDRKIDLAKLSGAQWILPPLETSNSRTVFEAFRECGLGAPKVMLVTFSQHLRISMLADANTVTVLPRSVINLGADRSTVKALPIKLPKHDFPLAIVTAKRRVPNPAAQLLIAHLREGLRSYAASLNDTRGGYR